MALAATLTVANHALVSWCSDRARSPRNVRLLFAHPPPFPTLAPFGTGDMTRAVADSASMTERRRAAQRVLQSVEKASYASPTEPSKEETARLIGTKPAYSALYKRAALALELDHAIAISPSRHRRITTAIFIPPLPPPLYTVTVSYKRYSTSWPFPTIRKHCWTDSASVLPFPYLQQH